MRCVDRGNKPLNILVFLDRMTQGLLFLTGRRTMERRFEWVLEIKCAEYPGAAPVCWVAARLGCGCVLGLKSARFENTTRSLLRAAR